MKTIKCLALFLLLAPLFAHLKPRYAQASFYGSYFNGRQTASGERLNTSALTAAHKSLPFGAVVRVESLERNGFVDVRINDRGPFVAGRELDLTPAAFKKIAPLSRGVANVRYWRIK